MLAERAKASAEDIACALQLQPRGRARVRTRLSPCASRLRNAAIKYLSEIRSSLREEAQTEVGKGVVRVSRKRARVLDEGGAAPGPVKRVRTEGRVTPRELHQLSGAGAAGAPLPARARQPPPAGVPQLPWAASLRGGAARRKKLGAGAAGELTASVRCSAKCSCSVWDLKKNGLYGMPKDLPNPALRSELSAAGLDLRETALGRSLFATRAIPEGAVVCLFSGFVLAAPSSSLFHPYLLHIPGYFSVIPYPCSACSYIDHAPKGSPECNIILKMRASGPPAAVALRGLAKGECLCFDYSGKGVSSAEHFKHNANNVKDLLAALEHARGLKRAGVSPSIVALMLS